MIPQREFYFIRHGQTDQNILEGTEKGDYSEDSPLNEIGKNQAKSIIPIISSLPIQTICSSSLKRALETKEILSVNLKATHHEIEDLTECSSEIWEELLRLKKPNLFPKDSAGKKFTNRVQKGIQKVLSLPGPSLIVAHGGVHFALCALLEIENHEWAINNCILVHFFVENGKWIAKKL